MTELPFFASKVQLGHDGLEEFLPLGPLIDYEKYAVTIDIWSKEFNIHIGKTEALDL